MKRLVSESDRVVAAAIGGGAGLILALTGCACLLTDGVPRLALLGAAAAMLLGLFRWAGRLRILLHRQFVAARARRDREAELEERYRDLVENANDIVFSTDPEGRIVTFNAAGERITGFSRETVRGWTLYDLAELNTKTINRCLHSSEAMTIEMVIRTRDGERVHLEVSTRPLHRAGRLCGIEGIARDVTLRKKAEEELRRAYQLQTMHIENTPLAMIEWDERFRVARWSSRAELLFGWPASDALGKSIEELEILEPQEVTGFRAAVVRLMRRTSAEHSYRTRSRSRGGELIHCEWYHSALRDDEDELLSVLSLIDDKTEQVRAEERRAHLEEQVRHAHKMEAVGRLAGGIAHDFNNLLTVINGNSALLLRSPALASDEREMIDEVNKAGEQAALLTRQLLAFSRKQILAPTTLDLNHVIRDLQKILLRLLPVNIEVRMHLDPFLLSIKADPGLMTQMILNLAVNARDAMPHGGQLDFRTRNLTTGWIRLEVQDNGQGMDDATSQRIFEPFFTTKPAGSGTGLGLSTVASIVEQSGGRIAVETQPGEGCLFRVDLPCSHSAATAPLAAGSDVRTTPQGTGTILLVEDEECVRTLARRVLELKGYTVLMAESGPAALEVFAGHQRTIQLVLTDVMMPEMTGRELAEELLRRRPGLPIIFMSGYTTDDVLRQGIETEQVAFLQKPFTPDALTRKIQGVLRGEMPLEAAPT